MSLIGPGCVKTLGGITAPGILGSTVMWRAKKRKNLSSARHYDQIGFRSYTTKAHRCPCATSAVWSLLSEAFETNAGREQHARHSLSMTFQPKRPCGRNNKTPIMIT
jgi:hypothetical protein